MCGTVLLLRRVCVSMFHLLFAHYYEIYTSSICRIYGYLYGPTYSGKEMFSRQRPKFISTVDVKCASSPHLVAHCYRTDCVEKGDGETLSEVTRSQVYPGSSIN